MSTSETTVSPMPVELAQLGWRLHRDRDHWRAGNARLELATRRCPTPMAAVAAAREKQADYETRLRARAGKRRSP